DLGSVDAVNDKLDEMGKNIGARVVDEYLARAEVTERPTFPQTADHLAKHAIPMFLGVTCSHTAVTDDSTNYTLTFDSNPVAQWVTLPDELKGLKYSQV
ncbi:Bet3-like protein, partial [Kipferlia bialata]